MAAGLTRREQWALIGVVTLIAAGLAIQAWRAGHSEGSVVYVPGQGRWEKLADFEAGQRPQPPATNTTRPPNGPSPATTATATRNASVQGQKSEDSSGLEINRATADEFDRLPGIGPAKARAIIETRAKLGGFSSIDQLDNVPGIGAKTLERLRPYLKLESAPSRANATTTTPATATTMAPPPRVAAENKTAVKAPDPAALRSATISTPTAAPHLATVPAAPPPQAAPQASPKTKGKAGKTGAAEAPLPVIDVNNAPAAELEKISGVGPVLAQRIVEERTAHGPFLSPRDLTRVKGIGPRNLLKMLPQVVTGPGQPVRPN